MDISGDGREHSFSLCVHRTSYKEAAAACFEPVGPLVAWGKSGYFEGTWVQAWKEGWIPVFF